MFCNDATVSKFVCNQGKVFVEKLGKYASELNCYFAVGIAEDENGDLKNRAVIFTPDGKRVYQYNKLHLTRSESDNGFKPGSRLGVFDCNGTRLGFAVCFDIYFPEYIAAMAAEQIDILIHQTYQRSEDADRIEVITRTRAIDSGAWILRSSYSLGDTSPNGGRSMLVSPSGEVLSDSGSGPGVLVCEFDPKEKFTKPASFGCASIVHRELIESKRRPGIYRPAIDKNKKYLAASYPRLCAHRGLSFAMPENTIPAFAAAIAAGAHEIEFDLWLSADGVPVVCHDPNLNRVAGVDMIVTESSWEDISKVDGRIQRRGIQAA